MNQAQEDIRCTEGIVHAATQEGFKLPVIDVTHRRFAVPTDPEAIGALCKAFIRSEAQQGYIPRFVMRWLLRSASRRSRLMRALFASDAGFLDGVTTYVMKLGTDNLVPPFDSPTDHRLAASPHTTLLRLRTQQVAHLIADGITGDLALAQDAPFDLINIAGGPAIDSLNALILLNRTRPDLLKRPLAIHVLDSAEAGAYFGAHALAALKAEGAPLAGLDIAFRHHAYDWNQTKLLEDLLGKLAAGRAVVAASSEGGLFEYGSDDAIIANLQALRAGTKLVAGSVTRADETRRRMIAQTRFKLVPRGLDGFAPLALRAGYTIVHAETAFLSDQVLLRSC